jgi:hypothetical protein
MFRVIEWLKGQPLDESGEDRDALLVFGHLTHGKIAEDWMRNMYHLQRAVLFLLRPEHAIGSISYSVPTEYGQPEVYGYAYSGHDLLPQTTRDVVLMGDYQSMRGFWFERGGIWPGLMLPYAEFVDYIRHYVTYFERDEGSTLVRRSSWGQLKRFVQQERRE